jgi:hypothetical protein
MNEVPDTANQQTTPSTLPSDPTEPRLKGVGGCLLFFSLSLTVFNPILALSSIVVRYTELSQYFAQFPNLALITDIDAFLTVGMIAFSIYAGTGLWFIRPGAVQMAKKCLLCSLGWVVVTSLLPFLAGFSSAGNKAMVMPALRSITRAVIYVAFWYLYLNRSERVRCTYVI